MHPVKRHTQVVVSHPADPTSHLRGDGSVFPPVTPDPPAPPGYLSPLDDSPALLDLTDRSDRSDRAGRSTER